MSNTITTTPVAETKQARQSIKDLHAALAASPRKSRSRSIALTKLEEAGMWLGKDLQELNEPSPYPRSHDAADPAIDATAPEACALPGLPDCECGVCGKVYPGHAGSTPCCGAVAYVLPKS
ncbi:MAG: hypothetical protein V4726_00840 [Verrucomicrobiota bacterium]